MATQTPGQLLVAAFVDTCKAEEAQEMLPMKGQVARRATELLQAGVPVDEAEEVVIEFVRRRGRTPLQLSEIYAELRREQGPLSQRPSLRRKARVWIELNGWPSGARLVRGTNSSSYAYHPLGLERIPSWYEWPFQQPTFEEIVEAVAADDGFTLH